MIRVEFRPDLRVRRGKLAPEGVAVHAATFLRQRHIVLDSELQRRPRELRRIFLHELFHFVWWKLGNPRRLEWETVLACEIAKRVRGELGWSAEIRKKALTDRDIGERTRKWREYCCESFCDTGASNFMGRRKHAEFTLAKSHREKRERWFRRGDIIQSEEQLVEFVEPDGGRGGFVWDADMPCVLAGAGGARAIGKGSKGSPGSA
jgi:hypothetical protein